MDGAFQSAAVLVAEMGSKVPMVPVSVASAVLGRTAADWEVWSHVSFTKKDLRAAHMNVLLFSGKGKIVAKLNNLVVRAIDTTPVADIPKDLLWEIEWQPRESLEATVASGDATPQGAASPSRGAASPSRGAASPSRGATSPSRKPGDGTASPVSELATPTAIPKRTLFLGTPANMDLKDFMGVGAQCFAELPDISDLENLLKDEQWESLVYLGPLNSQFSAVDCVDDCMKLSQCMISLPVDTERPPMWIVTQGQQQLPEHHIVSKPIHSGLIALCRSARLEIENTVGKPIQLGYLDLDSNSNLADNFESCMTNVMRMTNALPYEADVAVRGDTQFVARLVKSSLECRGAVELFMPDRGALSLLRLRPLAQAARVAPPDQCAEIRVRAIGLNFRDVLNVMGLYPGDPGPPGSDCAGTLVALGTGVKDKKIGQNVYGVAAGCLRTYATTSADLLAEMPKSMIFEEAAALPVVGVTVELGLGDMAKTKCGENVLVHAVTGGVGMTAVQFCKRIGATVYGTCSGGKKEKYIRSLGVEHVTTSRDAAVFEEDMKSFLGPDGRVSVVLNSLFEEYIPASVRLLEKNGRFIELGKRGIWTAEQMKQERPDVFYEAVAVDTMTAEKPAWFRGMLDRVRTLVDDGHLHSLPLHVFEMANQEDGAVAAFRFMQRAQHIGKVIIRITSALVAPTPAQPAAEHALFADRTLECDKTYVISGGMGGLGLVVAKWLVEEGARHLVLLSRRGKPSKAIEQLELWKWLTSEQSIAEVYPLKCDVSKASDCVAVFEEITKKELPPVRGVFHAAGVTADAAIPNQSRASIEEVFLPKVDGGWNLHNALDQFDLNKSLEVFMTFSSVAAMVGNFGQANYSAANAVLDGLVQWRRGMGLCGQSIQWGPWIEQGMAADLRDVLTKAGMRGITNELGIRVMGDVMRNAAGSAVIGCQSLVWKNFLRRYAFETPSYLADVSTLGMSVSDVGVDLSTISKEELTNMICVLAQQVSGSSELPSSETPLLDLGLDSLGAVEFRNSVADVTGTKLPQNLIFDNPTVSGIAQYIMERGGGGDSGGGISPSGRPRILDTPLDQWLMNSLDPEERFALYIDSFSKEYDSLAALAQEEDIMTALESLGVDDNSDFERLHVAWTDLCDAVHAGKNAAGGLLKLQAVGQPTTGATHPLEDIEVLKDSISFDIGTLKPATPIGKVKKVLLTGATGFVGRIQVATLLRLSHMPNLVVCCIVRAKSSEHAIQRIKAACEEAKCWEDHFTKRIVAMPGDFEKPMLGLSEASYTELCRDVDIVYHTGGDVNLLSNYARLRTTNTLSIKHVVDLCTTHKVKPVHFASTLGQFPAFFALFAGEFAGQILTEESQPDLQEMERFYPPIRQGYPWSKWAAEQVLRKAKDLGLPVSIYRLPNTYVAHNTGYTNKSDYAAALMIASIQEGIFPIGAATAPLTPVDTICEMLIGASLLQNPKHWLYHLFDPRLVTRQDLESWADEMGIIYKGVKVDEFLAAVKARGPLSPVFKFLPLMQYWRKFWFDPDERSEAFPIRNQNIFDDLPHMQWPPLKEIFENSFIYSIEFTFFPRDSKSLILDAAISLREAYKITGLNDMGGMEEYHMEPARKLATSLVEDCKPSFAGQLTCYRSHRQHMINVLSMQDRLKRYPEIEQQPIVKPLIIVGLNRTGTTFFQNLLAKDSSNRPALYYEMLAPYGQNGTFTRHGLEEPLADDERVSYARRTLDMMKVVGVNEEWATIHEQRAELPEEEFMVMEQCGRAYSLCVEFGIPSYREWLFANDCQEMKNGYPFLKRFLQHLQWQRKGGDRWMLKMPFHLFTLDALLETYPDAMIVFMHRDPKEIMGSWGSLVKHTQEAMLTEVDKEQLGKIELDGMSKMIGSALTYRQNHPETKSRFCDLQYKDLVSDPIGTLKKMYKHFDLTLTKPNSTAISNFISENRKMRDKMTKHSYSLQDVGLNEKMIETAFSQYYKSGYLKYKS
eukprot:GHVS01029517.1.p1 GENE.GHVS01029517.1~~GHVS01029517.1.p1  ORF type:complete len:2046 (-),score=279.27 GHVS01029517.1:105-6029(-)